MSTLKSTQVFDDAKGKQLNQILADLTITAGSNSLTLPDGTIIKWGNTGAFASIPANSSATLAVAFPVAFPNKCDYFGVILTPGTTSDFYGVTSLVSKAKDQAQFVARNGATAQTVASGVWIAIGS